MKDKLVLKAEEEVRRILNGIDDWGGDAWWPTSLGAEFGTKKLQEIIEYAITQENRISDLEILLKLAIDKIKEKLR